MRELKGDMLSVTLGGVELVTCSEEEAAIKGDEVPEGLFEEQSLYPLQSNRTWYEFVIWPNYY